MLKKSRLNVVALLSLWGCGDGGSTTGPPEGEGVLRVSTITTGAEPDPDGFLLVVDGGTGQSIGANDALDVSGLSVGNHSVALGGISDNCTIDGENPRTVAIVTGRVAATSFDIVCESTAPPAGSIRITVTTTGALIDNDEFSVSVDEDAPLVISTDASLVLSGVAPGPHAVTLGRVASNCVVQGENPHTITAVAGDTMAIAFAVVCQALEGRFLFSSDRSGDFDIYTVEGDGTNLTKLTNVGGQDLRAQWSPDGSKIVFESERDGNREIYVMNADGSDVRRLTNEPAIDVQPTWAPDGTRIAFTSARDGSFDIYVMDVDGSDVVPLTSGSGAETYGHPTWSPDGSKIALSFSRQVDPATGAVDSDLQLMNPDGTELGNLTSDLTRSDYTPAWSPDGTKIAFAGEDVTRDIFAINADGSGIQRLTEDPATDLTPRWSPDGSQLAFASTRGGSFDVYVLSTTAKGEPVNLTRNNADDTSPDWTQ